MACRIPRTAWVIGKGHHAVIASSGNQQSLYSATSATPSPPALPRRNRMRRVLLPRPRDRQGPRRAQHKHGHDGVGYHRGASRSRVNGGCARARGRVSRASYGTTSPMKRPCLRQGCPHLEPAPSTANPKPPPTPRQLAPTPHHHPRPPPDFDQRPGRPVSPKRTRSHTRPGFGTMIGLAKWKRSFRCLGDRSIFLSC